MSGDILKIGSKVVLLLPSDASVHLSTRVRRGESDADAAKRMLDSLSAYIASVIDAASTTEGACDRKTPSTCHPPGDEELTVELFFCVVAECLRLHGVRLATRTGTGPSSRYLVCDECYQKRLTPAEREHMVEIAGVDRVRELGLHELHNGRFRE